MAGAEVAQLVECNLAKVEVAGSTPVFRSRVRVSVAQETHPRLVEPCGCRDRGRYGSIRFLGDVAEWLGTALQKLQHRFDSGRRLLCGVRLLRFGRSPKGA